MNRKKRIILGITGMVLLLLVSSRIYYVNRHARLPEVKQAAQGESILYRGMEYRIVHAELWDYTDFFEQNEEWKEYKKTEKESAERKMLIVEYQIEKKEEENQMDFYMPIQYEYLFNGIDPFMMQDMNPSLGEGTFRSGDTLVIPYEIYRENLTEEQWEQVENMTMDYTVVLGTYPVRNELLITDIEAISGEREE